MYKAANPRGSFCEVNAGPSKASGEIEQLVNGILEWGSLKDG